MKHQHVLREGTKERIVDVLTKEGVEDREI